MFKERGAGFLCLPSLIVSLLGAAVSLFFRVIQFRSGSFVRSLVRSFLRGLAVSGAVFHFHFQHDDGLATLVIGGHCYHVALFQILQGNVGMDGVEVLKRLRSQGISTPALFLTAKTEVYQRVEGLDAGADDYLPKPFATSELLARVRAMLRRKENFVPDLLTVGDLSLNRSTYELLYHNEARSLSGREFQIMEILMQRPGFVVTTDVFLSHVWGWNSEVDISVVWVHISNIRKKLHQLHAPAEIKFIRGAGYVLEVGK